MDPGTLLTTLLKVGGVTALTVGVFYLLYRQILSLKIFSKMGQIQTFMVICLLAVLVWSAAMTALLANDSGLRAIFINSNNNQVHQGRN